MCVFCVFFIFDLLVMFFTLFFLFRDGEKWFSFSHDLTPMSRSDKEHVMTRIHDTVIGVSRGWLLTGLIQGVTATVAYLAVGMDGAVLLGALTAFFGLVPGVGTVGIWVPVAIILLAKGLYWRSAFILVWGAFVVVGLIDSIARPYLIGRRIELPLFVLFFALLGGVIVWGAKGVIIGPILVGIAPVLLDIYRDRYLRTPEVLPKAPDHSLKIAGLFIIGLSLLMAIPLRAESPETSDKDYTRASAHLKKHEDNMERMEADRSLDNEHTRQANEEFRKGTAELSGHDEQHLMEVQELRSINRQIAASQLRNALARQTYKQAVHNYGSDDPRSIAAKETWTQGRHARGALLQRQRALNQDIYQGRLLVHNDKTVLSVQKRAMDSDARYRASDDRRMLKEEKNIADDRNEMAEHYRVP